MSTQTLLVLALVGGAVGLVARQLWRTVRSLRQATAGPAVGCGDGCGCGPSAASTDTSDRWDEVATPTTRARTR